MINEDGDNFDYIDNADKTTLNLCDALLMICQVKI